MIDGVKYCFQRVLLGVLAALQMPALPAHGQEMQSNPFVNQEFYVAAGMFFPDRKLKLGLDGAVADVNTDIDFSGQFQMDGADESASVELVWRIGEQWTFRGQYFRVGDDNTAVLAQDVDWGEFTLNAGSNASAGSEIQISRFYFGRRFRDREKSTFGIGGGIHWLSIEAFISGQAFIDGANRVAFCRDHVVL
jgi:hypothetical protein